jgi:hypothetical protein
LFPELKGKILFIFSDPGGAKPLLSYIMLNGLEKSACVISDRSYDFYNDFPIIVTKWYSDGDVMLKIKEINPDYVFTATSYTSDIELRFLNAAKDAGIPTYSFVDHYTRFKDRFTWKGERLMPDNVCVIDEEAAHLAKESGITANLLVSGNFYHNFLEGWKPKVKKDDFFKEIGIPVGNKLLVFAPDPISNVGSKEDFGFDEVMVWQQISAYFGKLAYLGFSVVINMHPNQNKEYFSKHLDKHDMQIIFGHEIHTNTLLYFSDVVVGMFSNILIESVILKKRVIRYMVGFKKEDPFAGKRIGEVAYTNPELEKIFSTL